MASSSQDTGCLGPWPSVKSPRSAARVQVHCRVLGQGVLARNSDSREAFANMIPKVASFASLSHDEP